MKSVALALVALTAVTATGAAAAQNPMYGHMGATADRAKQAMADGHAAARRLEALAVTTTTDASPTTTSSAADSPTTTTSAADSPTTTTGAPMTTTLPPMRTRAPRNDFDSDKNLPAKCREAAAKATRADIDAKCASFIAAQGGDDGSALWVEKFKVCNSDCGTVLKDTYASYGKDGFAGDAAKVVGGIVDTCATKPECYSTTYTSPMVAAFEACNTDTASLEALFNNTLTSSALDATCGSSCVTGITAFTKTWDRCIDDDVRLVSLMANFMCDVPAGGTDRCAIQLRTLGKYECDDYKTSGTCVAAAGKSCLWNDGECEGEFKAADLPGVCTTCLQKFSGIVGFVDKSAGKDIEGFRSLVCLKDGDTYCMPVAQPLMNADDLFAFGDASTDAARKAVVDDVCVDSAKQRCTKKLFIRATSLDIRKSVASFAKCAQAWRGTDEATVTKVCKPHLDAIKAKAAGVAKSLAVFRFLCLKNDAAEFCVHKLEKVARQSSCYGGIVAEQACPSASGSCAGYVQDVTDLGCCAVAYSKATRFRAVVPKLAPVMVGTSAETETAVDFTPTGEQNVDRSWKATVFAALQNCSDLNTKAFRTNMTTVCAAHQRTKAPAKRALRLKLSWAAVSGDAALKLRLELALQEDTAGNVGLMASQILNPALVEDTAARRAGAASTSAFTFELDADDDTEADAAAAAFDAALAAGTLELISTADVTSSDECVGCVNTKGSIGSGTNDLFGTSETVGATTTAASTTTAAGDASTTTASPTTTATATTDTSAASSIGAFAAAVAVAFMAIA